MEKEGFDIIYSDLLDKSMCRKLSKNISKELYWKYSREAIGAYEMVKNRIDGVVFLSTFPCGLDSLVRATYSLLGLKTFFTVGTDEVRAWTFKNDMKAPECAGIIHSDFERGFIRAEVMSYTDLIECGNEVKVKEAGKMRLEGKEYEMQDGDICHFRFNVWKNMT